MTKQERLFRAISGADEELLERSEGCRRRRWPAGLAAAACLVCHFVEEEAEQGEAVVDVGFAHAGLDE